MIKIDKGAPQGGILSPELFIRYINNLIEKTTAPTGKYIFADDLCAKILGKANLNLTITQLQNESRKDKLTINTKKSALLILSQSRATFTKYEKNQENF